MAARLIGLIAALAAAVPAGARPVQEIRSLVTEPIAPRGSVMMLPLGARRPGDRWPSTVTLTLADGTTVEALVAWLEIVPPSPSRRVGWTDDMSGLRVRPITPTDDGARPDLGGPYLLARLPEIGDGPIDLEGQTLRPLWWDPQRSYGFEALPGPDRPALPLAAAPDRPDASSPFHYWRWVLLADALDHRPPGTAHFDDASALVAEHYAAVWRTALGRLGAESLRTATACRDTLVRVCTDPPQRFAAWITEPDELSRLLGVLLDRDRTGDTLVRDAQAWIETRRPVAAWTEAEHVDDVAVAIVNRGFTPLVGRLAWEGQADEPTTVPLPAGELTRVRIPRPAPPPASPLGLVEPADPRRNLLALRAGPQVIGLAFGPAATPARPPGIVLPPLRPPLTLAELDAEQARPGDPRTATAVEVRSLGGRWEVFAEARRPPAGEARSAEGAEEAITVFVGSEAHPRVTVTVPETGPPRFLTGSDDGMLEVHRRSYDDRWYARLVLPPSWIDARGPLLVGVRRSHAGGGSIETSPHTSVPWRHEPGREVIAVDAWDR